MKTKTKVLVWLFAALSLVCLAGCGGSANELLPVTSIEEN